MSAAAQDSIRLRLPKSPITPIRATGELDDIDGTREGGTGRREQPRDRREERQIASNLMPPTMEMEAEAESHHTHVTESYRLRHRD